LVLAYLSDESGSAVGLVTALQFIPTLLLSAFAGVLADRVNQRKLLMVTQGSMGVLAAGLGALVLTGSAELWHVYFFAFLLGIASASAAPARQTFLAGRVPGQGQAEAVARASPPF